VPLVPCAVLEDEPAVPVDAVAPFAPVVSVELWPDEELADGLVELAVRSEELLWPELVLLLSEEPLWPDVLAVVP